jgi:hypothetical protein
MVGLFFSAIDQTDPIRRKNYVQRQRKMLLSMPWAGLQREFIKADSENLKIIVQTDDAYVSTLKIIHFV